jgi:hypothetical protein
MRKTTVSAPMGKDPPGEILAPLAVPAIDEFVTRFSGRGSVGAAEVVDMLLDLRLLAVADEIVGMHV